MDSLAEPTFDAVASDSGFLAALERLRRAAFGRIVGEEGLD